MYMLHPTHINTRRTHLFLVFSDAQWQAQASTGQIVSIIANDAQRYDEFAVGVPFIWLAPLSAIAGVLVIVMYVGWPAALAGCCATVGLMPVQMLCGREVGQVSKAQATGEIHFTYENCDSLFLFVQS